MNQEELFQKLQAAVSFHNQGELDKAEAIYRDVLAVDAKNFYALNFLGCILRSKEMLDEARNLLAAAVIVKPGDIGAQFNLGNVLRDMESWDEALACYQIALKLNPIDSSVLYEAGNAYRMLGDTLGASESYRRAIEVKPDFAEAYLNLGNLFKEEGELEEAIGSYRKAIELKSDFAEAYLNLGNLFKEEGELEEAIGSCRKAIEFKPDFAEAYFNLGNLLKEGRDFEAAIMNYHKAIELNPDFVNALSEMAGILSENCEYEQAISLYQRALDVDDEHVNSIAGLGWTFLRADRHQQAIVYYASLLRKTSINTDAFFFLFESFKGRLQKKLVKEFSYTEQFLGDVLNTLSVSRIVAFGDSHVLLFEDIKDIEVNHVGASTAYNLIKKDTSTGGRQRVLNRTKRMDPKDEAVLLCFGEVDIRANILKYCYRHNLSIQVCVSNVVSRYLEFADEIISQGFKVLVYGGYGSGSDRIAFGSEAERNYAADYLNRTLDEACKKKGIIYFSLHDCFFDSASLKTDSRFLVDDFHLYSDGNALREVQLLLLERMSRVAKKFAGALEERPSAQLVLGNVGCDGMVVKGSLDGEVLVWESEVDFLHSIVFDLNAFISFDSVILLFADELDVDAVNFVLDGRAIAVDVVQEAPCKWRWTPADLSSRFVGRYPMLKAEYSILLSLNGVSFKVRSLLERSADSAL
ncbi:tetratricopeptide repeat protein [Prochlorococcus sp. MIT 1306]|uniref:tetratricopeptide repeat protein n=1 Tax=Prochlorococcus sp. MIT 1306 TaxID=1799667 RepID=UPI0018D44BB1|nr:tetratricopeptide repeat protein [Prochlorococcus sp. MIT 1306]